MGKRIQLLLTIACVLLSVLTAPAMINDKRVSGVRFDTLLFARAVANSPQTTSKKRRNVRSKRRAPATPKSGSQTTNEAVSQGTTRQTSPPTTQGPLSQVAYELPLKKPGIDERQEQGLLTNVYCDAKGVTFNVTAGDRVLKLWTSDLNKINFATYTPDVSGDITCGARKPANKVVVIYRPSTDTPAKLNGTLVTMEFVPKNFELKK